MVRMIDDEFMVCCDCIMAIANGDLTALANDPETEDERTRQIHQGLQEIADNGGYAVAGDSDKYDEFSRYPCECCGERLAGSRHHAVILANETITQEDIAAESRLHTLVNYFTSHKDLARHAYLLEEAIKPITLVIQEYWEKEERND